MIRNLSFGLGRKSNYICNVIGSIELFNVCLCLIILVINKGLSVSIVYFWHPKLVMVLRQASSSS